MPDVTTSANVDTLLQAADFSTFRTSLGLTALATTTPGTGVATALAVNVGTDGAFVVRGGNAGTPSALVGTNITGTAASLTAGTASAVAVGGITGLGSGVGTFLATPSSANLASAVTGETGSGALVFGTSPGFTTAANPVSNDGAALGTTALGWSDVHLATGAVINVANGNAVITHSSGIFTVSTGDFRVTTAGANSASAVTVGGVQALSNKQIQLTAAHGTDDTWQGTSINGLNAGATIAQWEAVYLGASSTWLLADANGSGTYPARGLAVAAYTNGNAAEILVRGTARNDAWNWTPGGAIYMSATAGALSQTAPSTSGDIVQVIGFALTADIAYFDFNGEYLTLT